MHSLAAKYDKTLARLAEDRKAVTAEEAERDAEDAAVADSRAQASQAQAAGKTQQSKFDEQVRLFVTCTTVRKVNYIAMFFGTEKPHAVSVPVLCSCTPGGMCTNCKQHLVLAVFCVCTYCFSGGIADGPKASLPLQVAALRDPLLDLLNCPCCTGRDSSNN